MMNAIMHHGFYMVHALQNGHLDLTSFLLLLVPCSQGGLFLYDNFILSGLAVGVSALFLSCVSTFNF